ncbi:hypothetical protein F5X68DRAFT_252670 [Plectosphaerella plurivora]|uniref:Uncharacterized protein n=1 Tax=Plectosphaerella plurivora TaxID=936078 RepID=A0A9P9ACZ1_9PEZI|nr:hypothetical protein F5X68DRAFT_252670 [Plectosphaerella plurivora]
MHYQPSPTTLDPWAVHLIHYFSENIASCMQAIDGQHDGYRHLLLPIAHTSPLVLAPVLATAAFHMSRLETVESFSGPRSSSRLYNQALVELQKYQDFENVDTSTRLQILLAILTLLVNVMVTGSDDFPIIFRLLESALKAMGGEDELGRDELATFIVRQIHKMRVYAAPFLSEEEGIAVLSSKVYTTYGLNCLRFCSQQQPGLAAAVPIIESLVQQACGIYLSQAVEGPEKGMTSQTEDSTSRVQRFKDTLVSFPPGAPGEQVLIWATFVAASDCLLAEHQSFFRGVLRRLYEMIGFANLLKGIEQLEIIWQRRRHPGDRWTSMLPLSRAFVM